MTDQARQCDIFKKIASQWKNMTPEEKKPYEDQVDNDLLFLLTRLKMIVSVIRKK